MYTKEDVLKKLENFNDKKFTFNEKYHTYKYNDEIFISVTTLLKKFSTPFNADFFSRKKAIEIIDQEQGDLSEKNIIKVQKDVIKDWDIKRDHASNLGTKVHQYIENYFNKKYNEIPNDLEIVDRINKFNILYAKHLYKLNYIGGEIKIFSINKKIAGTIDGLFLYKGKIIILDYKTNKEWYNDDNKKYSYLLNEFNMYYDNEFNKYSIQLSLYSLLLEEIGLNVDSSYLCHLSPNDDSKLYKARNFKNELKEYLNKNIYS